LRAPTPSTRPWVNIKVERNADVVKTSERVRREERVSSVRPTLRYEKRRFYSEERNRERRGD